MIVRILHEGQYQVPDGELDRLNTLDSQLLRAIRAGDEAAFTSQLARLLGTVRALGGPVPEDQFVSSDLVLPSADADLAEVAALIGADGLIPG